MVNDRILEATTYIKNKLNSTPTIGLILGSGLGVLADEITEATHYTI